MVQFITGHGPFRIACGLSLILFAAAATSALRDGGQPSAASTADEPVEAIVSDVGADAATGTGPTDQPIAFSHRHHVTDIGIDCQLCHVYARRSPVAGIPSVEICAGCHRQVLPDSPEIQRVLEFWENEEPIPWVRIHDLPDHARFSHKRHVLGGVSCANCHGDVGQMDVVVRVESLSMGWCVTCHKEREAPLDCLACHY